MTHGEMARLTDLAAASGTAVHRLTQDDPQAPQVRRAVFVYSPAKVIAQSKWLPRCRRGTPGSGGGIAG